MTGGGATRSLLLFCPNCQRWVTFAVTGGSHPPTLQCSCGAVYAYDPAVRKSVPSRRYQALFAALTRERSATAGGH